MSAPHTSSEPLPSDDLPACIRCGNSCRVVYLWQGDLSHFKERDTKRWVEYHGIETFVARRNGATYWGVKIEATCRYLYREDDGRFGCAVYDRRPFVCRIYRGWNPDGAQPGCGYHRAAPDTEDA